MCRIYVDMAVCHRFVVSCGTIWLYTSHIDHCNQGASDPNRCPNALISMPPFTGTFDDLFAGPCNDCMASMAAPRRPQDDVPEEEEQDDIAGDREDVSRVSSDEEGNSTSPPSEYEEARSVFVSPSGSEEGNSPLPSSEYADVPPEYEETPSEYEEGLGILLSESPEVLFNFGEVYSEYAQVPSEYAESFGIIENEDGSIIPSDDEASRSEASAHDNDADNDDDAWTNASSDINSLEVPTSPNPSIWSASSTAEWITTEDPTGQGPPYPVSDDDVEDDEAMYPAVL
jgi:hypothetical protein